jgi:uncharacterized protein (DUF736 family)
MQKYDNKNSFVLFANSSANPKAPNFSGTFTDQSDKEWEIVAWSKTSKGGKEFLSGKIKEKGERGQGQKKFSTSSRQSSYFDEDVAF